MKFRLLFPSILLALVLSIPAAAKGYKVVLDSTKGDTTSYVLCGWEWGEKFRIDTAKAARSGKVTFSAKEDLECGNYAVYELSGRKITEFIVPRRNKDFSIQFAKDGEGYSVKRGNGENKLFVGFQNFLNYGWNKLESAEEFAARLVQMKEKAATEFPNSTAIATSSAFGRPWAMLREMLCSAMNAAAAMTVCPVSVRMFLSSSRASS
jgi:hypothetical protein